MTKNETVAVFYNGEFQRHVTIKQQSAEVAGKILKPREGFKRTAKLVSHTLFGRVWQVAYQQLEPAQ